jgi:GPH family glycoside/pentoside/hexuronide:cation symporter
MFYFLDKESVGMMFALQIAITFVLGPTSPLVWAMYADTADYSEWKTGRRATGLVFSAATFSQKAGWTIGGALAGWLLGYYGFKANVPASEETQYGIRMMMSFIPAVSSFLAAAFMFIYRLDEKTMTTIETELAQRKQTLPPADDGTAAHVDGPEPSDKPGGTKSEQMPQAEPQPPTQLPQDKTQ